LLLFYFVLFFTSFFHCGKERIETDSEDKKKKTGMALGKRTVWPGQVLLALAS
jgi:hypothetical protein